MAKIVFDFHGSYTHSNTALLRVVDALGELSLYSPNGKDPESGLSGLHWEDEETGMVPVEFPSELGKALIEGKRIYFRDADHRPVSLKKHSSKEGKPSYWSLKGSVFEIRYPID